jgi:hypothetical protein
VVIFVVRSRLSRLHRIERRAYRQHGADGECVYAYDQCAMERSPVSSARVAPVPALSWWGWLGAAAALLWSAFTALGRRAGAERAVRAVTLRIDRAHQVPLDAHPCATR